MTKEFREKLYGKIIIFYNNAKKKVYLELGRTLRSR